MISMAIPEIPREAIVEKTVYSFSQICSLLRLHVPSGLHSPSEQCLLGLASPLPARAEGKALRWWLCCLIFMLIQTIRRAWRNGWQFQRAISVFHIWDMTGGKGKVTNWKFSLFCRVRSCNFPNGIRAMQLSSSVLKLKSDLGGMFRVLSSVGVTYAGWYHFSIRLMYLLWQNALLGRCEDIRLIVSQRCHVWVVLIVAPILGKMFGCTATDFCLFFP